MFGGTGVVDWLRISRRRSSQTEGADLQEDLDQLRIELSAGVAVDLFARRFEGLGGAIGPVGGDGVESVGDGEEASAERDRVRLRPRGYPVPS